MDLALVVIAAGLGSRFGGNKQLVEVGPTGEVFFDFASPMRSVPAPRTWYSSCRREFERTVRDHTRRATVTRSAQHRIPGRVRATRTKPQWAPRMPCSRSPTSYASHSWSSMLTTTTARSLWTAAESLAVASPDTALLAAFELGNTLPQEGTVSRGVCRVEGDRLTSLVETHGIGRTADGRIVSTDPVGEYLDDAPVSMNMWGFAPEIFKHLHTAGPSSTRSTRTSQTDSCCRRRCPLQAKDYSTSGRAPERRVDRVTIRRSRPGRARLHALRG